MGLTEATGLQTEEAKGGLKQTWIADGKHVGGEGSNPLPAQLWNPKFSIARKTAKKQGNQNTKKKQGKNSPPQKKGQQKDKERKDMVRSGTTIWAISLEFCGGKPSISEADDLLGTCCREAMTPQKLFI